MAVKPTYNTAEMVTAYVNPRQDHFRHALAMVKLGYWWWQPATNDLEWSDTCFEFLGLNPHEHRASLEAFINAIHPDDRQSVQQSVEQVMVTGTAPDLEYRIQRPDGSIITVYTRAEMVYDHSGKPAYLFGTLQDITQQKQREEELRLAKKAAERADKSKSAFLSRMSHEFFTPLNAIVGFGHLLSEEDIGEDKAALVQEITQAGNHLTGLVKDILEYTYLESAVKDIQEINLSIFMQDIRMCHESEVAHAGQLLDMAPVENINFESDPTLLKTILDYLIDNAIKYNRPNGRICLGADSLNSKNIRLWVQDSGCGITPEFRRRIFKPFERQPQHDNLIAGTGLGLSIAKRISQLLGGKLDYSSDINEGSRFWIDLPRLQS